MNEKIRLAFRDDPEVLAVLYAKEMGRLAEQIQHIQLIPGPKGDVGRRGSQFIGVFSSELELPDVSSYQQGDFAIVDGSIWYIV